MNLKIYFNEEARQHVFLLTVDDLDFSNSICEMDPFEKYMMKECDESVLVSDKLLALERIALRIESARAPSEKQTKENSHE